MNSSYFLDITGIVRAAGPSVRLDEAQDILDSLKRLYSRIARELTDLGHFTILKDLEICEFLAALHDDSICEHIEGFLVGEALENNNPLHPAESSEAITVLGGLIPKVSHLPLQILHRSDETGFRLSNDRAVTPWYLISLSSTNLMLTSRTRSS